MKNTKINYEEYEMANGECVAMSTAPILLMKLRSKDKKSYETISRVLVKGLNERDVLEVYDFLYATYKNANQDEECMTFDEFLENANPSMEENVNTMKEMYSPSKKQDSEEDSN